MNGLAFGVLREVHDLQMSGCDYVFGVSGVGQSQLLGRGGRLLLRRRL